MERAEAARGPDWVIVGAALALTGLGIVLVYSTSTPLAFTRGTGDGLSYVKHSLLYGFLGVLACLACLTVRPETLRRLAYPNIVLCVALLCLPLVPGIGAGVKGAHRWVRLGGLGFQPSELAKFAVVVFLAHSLAKRGDRVKSFSYGFLPNVIIPAIPMLLILLEPDLGTAALIGVVVAAMTYAGGVRMKFLGMAVLPVLPVLGFLVFKVPWRFQRVVAFLDPWAHARGAGFQLVQSLLAFGTGGLWGVGLGAGRQKLYYLPEAHTDFILSVWAEEAGFAGVVGALAVVVLLVVRGFRIAYRQQDPFRRLLGAGISTWLGLQAGLNALVVTGCLPTKGLSFPFLSYGGTGIVMTLAAVGVLAGLAREEPGR